jgi:hypothetical protein
MSLSRKHYCAVADELAAAIEINRYLADKSAVQAVERVAEGLAKYFASDNPNFDRAKFLAACKVQS